MKKYKRLFNEEQGRDWFTSDLHFDDDRLNLYGRDLVFNSKEECADRIVENFNNKIMPNDNLYIVGDVSFTLEGFEYLSRINCKKFLIKGNYDDPTKTAKFDITDEFLSKYFDGVYDDLYKILCNKEEVYINHYPTNGKSHIFNVVGHIHGTWKVQRNMVNVGVDSWHFQPVSDEMILWQMNGIRKFYDQNVFAGELDCNLLNKLEK